MVNIEAEIFDRLYTLITTAYPNCNVVGEDIAEEPEFPCVSIVEMDNATEQMTTDTAGERHSNVTYKVEVYTNDRTGKRAKAKAILNVIDKEMTSLNFVRTTSTSTYLKYASVHRYITHYAATVSDDGKIFKRR